MLAQFAWRDLRQHFCSPQTLFAVPRGWKMLAQFPYHWTPQRRGLRAQGPSIILCAKKRSFQVPQRRGSPHSGEGKNGKDRLITAKRRGYGKFPVVGIQDLYKTDLQNSFRVIRIILRGVPGVVTQILSLT